VKNEIQRNREYASKIIEILLLLSRQGIALTGHDERSDSNNKGNFRELCSLFAKFDDSFSNKLESYFNMTSHDTQNELVQLARNQLVRSIVMDVHMTGFMCISADEARSFKSEQLALCIRYVTRDLEVLERFVTFKDCSNLTDAHGLAECITNGLKTNGLDNIAIVAQAYDGASVMSGSKNGVQSIIREAHPSAAYTHCMAHRLNLVLDKVCKVTRHAAVFVLSFRITILFFFKTWKS